MENKLPENNYDCWFPANIDFNSYKMIEYFFRRTHNERDVLQNCCSVFFNYNSEDFNYTEKELMVNNKYIIKFDDTHMGSYCTNNRQFIPFNKSGFPTLNMENPEERGYNLFSLIAHVHGFNQRNCIKEIYRRLGLKNDQEIERYRYPYKNLGYRLEAFSNIYDFTKIISNRNEKIEVYNSIDINNCEMIFKKNMDAIPYPLKFGYSTKIIYWYKNENGSINFGVIYFEYSDSIYKLPLTMWVPKKINKNLSAGKEKKYLDEANFGKLDLLHPLPPYPIYNKNLICDNPDATIIIVPNEENVFDYIINDIQNNKYITTTWSGGYKDTLEDTDWEYLEDRQLIISVVKDKEDVINCFNVYNRIPKKKFLGFALVFNNKNDDASFILNINNAKFYLKLIKYKDFLQYAYKNFGLEFDTSIIEKSVSLEEFKANPPSPPNYLLNNLLREGEQMMIFAPRGAGKSYFVSLLAVVLANGISVLNSKISANKEHKVLIIDGEMDEYLIHQRFEAIEKGLELEAPKSQNIKILSSSKERTTFNFSDEKQLLRYKADILAADVIILDSVTFTFPEAMGNNIDSAQSLNNFILSNRQNKISTIIIDHASTKSSKGKNLDSFGSSAKAFALNLIFYLEKDREITNIVITKSRSTQCGCDKYCSYKLNVENDDNSCIKTVRFMDHLSNKFIGKDQTNNNLTELNDQNRQIPILYQIYKNPKISSSNIAINLLELVPHCKKSTVDKIIRELINIEFIIDEGKNHRNPYRKIARNKLIKLQSCNYIQEKFGFSFNE